MSRKFLTITSFFALSFVIALRAEEKPAALKRLKPEGIDGALVLGGEKLPDAALDRFIELAGNEKANIVVFVQDKPVGATVERLAGVAKKMKVASFSTISPGDKKENELLQKATGVWFTGVTVGLFAIDEQLRHRGAVIGTSGNPAEVLAEGSLGGERSLPVNANKGVFDIGLDPGAALIVRGRQMTVLGDGRVTVKLRKSATLPERTVEITAKKPSDLTLLRRCAIARAAEPFPPKIAPIPDVPKGSLVIVGGGSMSAELTKKFIDLAGGPDALIVVLPIAAGDGPPPLSGEASFLKKAGAKNVVSLPARKLEEVENPKNLELVKKAGGVWFGGGRQWRFVDAYEGTKMHDAFRDVLKRGGVIGGSSAGATIQGDYLCRGSPFGNTEMMCEGYERGLGFLPGVAIDQHFAQRKRFGDMTALMKTYPQLLGIGLDEGTAIVVHGHLAEVMGPGQAHFYDRKKPVEKDKPDHESLRAGRRYDLKERTALK